MGYNCDSADDFTQSDMSQISALCALCGQLLEPDERQKHGAIAVVPGILLSTKQHGSRSVIGIGFKKT